MNILGNLFCSARIKAVQQSMTTVRVLIATVVSTGVLTPVFAGSNTAHLIILAGIVLLVTMVGTASAVIVGHYISELTLTGSTQPLGESDTYRDRWVYRITTPMAMGGMYIVIFGLEQALLLSTGIGYTTALAGVTLFLSYALACSLTPTIISESCNCISCTSAAAA